MLAARRECRGLLVSARTGKVLARRFHKFFNVDEREETMAENVERIIEDVVAKKRRRQQHSSSASVGGDDEEEEEKVEEEKGNEDEEEVVLLEKIDGCLVSPVLLRNTSPSSSGKYSLLWASKSQPIDLIDDYIAKEEQQQQQEGEGEESKRGRDYRGLAIEWIARGWTPLFEWCHPSMGSVIRHQQPSLVLLAVRHNVTGKYLSWGELHSAALQYNVVLTRRLLLSSSPSTASSTPTNETNERSNNVGRWKKEVEEWEPGREGVVVMLPASGRFYKLKSHWYRTLHSNSGIAQLAKVLAERPKLDAGAVPPAMIWAAVLSSYKKEVDDLLPVLRSAGNEEDARRLSEFVEEYHRRLDALKRRMQEWGAAVKRGAKELLSSSKEEQEKMEERIVQQILLKDRQESRASSSSSSLLFNKRKTLMCFVADNEASDEEAQEKALEEELNALIHKGKCHQVESLLDLSWERYLSSSSSSTETSASTFEDATNTIEIYCDLDGVLADFEGGLLKLTPSIPDNVAEIWSLIRRNKNFWKRLEPMDGAERLWSFLLSLQHRQEGEDAVKIKILTGVPDGKMGELAATQKRSWCQKHLPRLLASSSNAGQQNEEVEVITCQSSKKFEWSGITHVLIDDREELRQDWETMGGSFILHTDAESTIAQLQNVVLPQLSSRLKEVKQLLQSANETREREREKDSIYLVSEEDIIFVESRSENGNVEKLKEALSRARMVGLDVEWPPDELLQKNGNSSKLRSGASLLQIAVASDDEEAEQARIESRDEVFLVDLYSTNAEIEKAIVDMLHSPKVLKLGYGMDADLQRLRSGSLRSFHHVESSLDLMQIVPFLAPSQSREERVRNRRDLPSLAWLVERVLGVRMLKNKILQAFDWGSRPISLTHQQYAATDAACLLRLYSVLCKYPSLESNLVPVRMLPPSSSSSLFSNVSSSSASSSSSPKKNESIKSRQRVTIEYTAIFLSDSSRQKLLEKFPPIYPKVTCDHVTLAYAPSLQQVRELPVGTAVTVQVLSHHHPSSKRSSKNEKETECQAVVVRIVSSALEEEKRLLSLVTNEILHVTISTGTSVSPSQANEMLSERKRSGERGKEQQGELLLEGTIGLVVKNELVASVEIPPKLLREVEEFVENGQPGQYIELGKKQPLTAMERQALHKYAEEHGLESKSSGQKHHRILTLRIPHNSNNKLSPDDPSSKQSELKIIKSGNEEENRRLMKQANRKRPTTNESSSSKQKHVIQVKDKAMLDSLQLVFKSVVSEEESAKEQTSKKDKNITAKRRTRYGRVKEDGKVEMRQLPENELQQELFGLLESPEVVLDTEETRMVIILRGLPGSGKSSIVSALKQKLSPSSQEDEESGKQAIAICSADEYWQRGGGRYNKRELKRLDMSQQEIYLHCFDANRLEEAHSYCRDSFELALSNETPLIIVDNVNASRKDYKFYIERAQNVEAKKRYRVAVVEVLCESDAEMIAFHGRCCHGLPVRAIANVWTRWEKDPDAFLLSPFLSSHDKEDASSNEEYVEDEEEAEDEAGDEAEKESLLQWVSRKKFFGTNSTRKLPTHMIMQLEDRPVKFLSIPDDFNTEFLRRCAKDDSPQYFVEFASKPFFRMFVDVDYIALHEMSETEMLVIVRCMQNVLRQFYISSSSSSKNSDTTAKENDGEEDIGVDLMAVVTGGDVCQHLEERKGDQEQLMLIKSGKHVVFPYVLVTVEQALAIRAALIPQLEQLLPSFKEQQQKEQEQEENNYRHEWNEMLDVQVYQGPNPGMRMFGSIKTTKMPLQNGKLLYKEYGGPHSLQAVVDRRGTLDLVTYSRLSRDRSSLMQLATIRSSSSTPFLSSFSSSNKNEEKAKTEEEKKTVNMKLIRFDDLDLKPAKPQLVDHVLHHYLPRKLCNYLGLSLSQLRDDTIFTISSKAYLKEGGSEGKIRGMWEQFQKNGILDLRVDLQPPLLLATFSPPSSSNKSGNAERKEERKGKGKGRNNEDRGEARRSSHYGDEEYANWQVQFGASKVCKRSSRARPGLTESGAFAGVLLRLDEQFTFAEFREAMALSFSKRLYVQLSKTTEDEGEEELEEEIEKDEGEHGDEGESEESEEESETEEKEESEEEGEDEEKEEEEKEEERTSKRGKNHKHTRKTKHMQKHQLSSWL
ncbi:DNA repair exonuclease SbcCD D subunit [Balamuthia mandrillaris]